MCLMKTSQTSGSWSLCMNDICRLGISHVSLITFCISVFFFFNRKVNQKGILMFTLLNNFFYGTYSSKKHISKCLFFYTFYQTICCKIHCIMNNISIFSWKKNY
ncbi:hypothetical protein HMPREF9685_05491 [Klebsiella oxytoca 09-7231]|nr:hypothetical protein HMPREF9685_05491 [Klebsiella oxytoca 09-7231]